MIGLAFIVLAFGIVVARALVLFGRDVHKMVGWIIIRAVQFIAVVFAIAFAITVICGTSVLHIALAFGIVAALAVAATWEDR